MLWLNGASPTFINSFYFFIRTFYTNQTLTVVVSGCVSILRTFSALSPVCHGWCWYNSVSNVLILYNHNPFFSLYLCQDVPFIKSIPLPSDVGWNFSIRQTFLSISHRYFVTENLYQWHSVTQSYKCVLPWRCYLKSPAAHVIELQCYDQELWSTGRTFKNKNPFNFPWMA